jgi:hypothetical protein
MFVRHGYRNTKRNSRYTSKPRYIGKPSSELESWLKRNGFKNPQDDRSREVIMYGGWGTEDNKWSTTSFIHPIHQAINEKNYQIIYELVIEQSVNIDVKNQWDETPLMSLFNSCWLNELTKNIIRKGQYCTSDPNLWDFEDSTTLDISRFLIINGANINAKSKHHSKFLLHLAVEGSDVALKYVDLLIKEGVNIDVKDVHDFTPLHYACRSYYKSVEIMKLLIDNGSDLNAVINESYVQKKMTPLELMIYTKKMNNVRWMDVYYSELETLLTPAQKIFDRE